MFSNYIYNYKCFIKRNTGGLLLHPNPMCLRWQASLGCVLKESYYEQTVFMRFIFIMLIILYTVLLTCFRLPRHSTWQVFVYSFLHLARGFVHSFFFPYFQIKCWSFVSGRGGQLSLSAASFLCGPSCIHIHWTIMLFLYYVLYSIYCFCYYSVYITVIFMP